MKRGCHRVFAKPCRDRELLTPFRLVCLAIARDEKKEKNLVAVKERFASLSPREREVVIQVARVVWASRWRMTSGSPKPDKSPLQQSNEEDAGRFASRTRPDADKLNLVPDTPRRSQGRVFLSVRDALRRDSV